MLKRDFLLAQIEQISKVLSKILSDFLGLKSGGDMDQGIELMQEQLKAELDIDLEVLITLSKEEMKSYLLERKMANNHFEKLAEYLKEIGMRNSTNDREKANNYLKKALELIDLEDELYETMSFSRMKLRKEIEGEIC